MVIKITWNSDGFHMSGFYFLVTIGKSAKFNNNTDFTDKIVHPNNPKTSGYSCILPAFLGTLQSLTTA